VDSLALYRRASSKVPFGQPQIIPEKFYPLEVAA
jgi:hypothetical protein